MRFLKMGKIDRIIWQMSLHSSKEIQELLSLNPKDLKERGHPNSPNPKDCQRLSIQKVPSDL